ncbi:MAG: hypothetical protein A2074_07305 [Candidatus Aquicultor primus]|uniref:Uncharacterized protein n=1 Tax=Candidatus Aquicultor primus TaxID=1797195 RepID=A0A1F2UV99_9ACTN|nr:MAG: hypothetical protein A2074_07305 [Candidatus Aquicultor primus]HCG99834.1 hypothetical protein [Actinomycetota bacterium]
MSFIVAVEILNFILASLAALISLGILRKVTGNLAASWRYAVVAFQILALATLFAVINELGILSIAGISSDLLRNTAHFVFIILAFFGLLRNYQLIRNLTERDSG